MLSVVTCLGLSLSLGVIGLLIACLLFGVAYGCCTAVYAAATMLMSDPRIAASMFTIFMMFMSIGIALAQALGGSLTHAFGFETLASIMAVLSLPNLLLLRYMPILNPAVPRPS